MNLNFSELWILVECLCWCVCMLLFLFHFMEPNREISRPSFITDSFHISSLWKCENNSAVKLTLICFRDQMLLLFWKLSVMIYLVTQKLNVLILDVFLWIINCGFILIMNCVSVKMGVRLSHHQHPSWWQHTAATSTCFVSEIFV